MIQLLRFATKGSLVDEKLVALEAEKQPDRLQVRSPESDLHPGDGDAARRQLGEALRIRQDGREGPGGIRIHRSPLRRFEIVEVLPVLCGISGNRPGVDGAGMLQGRLQTDPGAVGLPSRRLRGPAVATEREEEESERPLHQPSFARRVRTGSPGKTWRNKPAIAFVEPSKLAYQRGSDARYVKRIW